MAYYIDPDECYDDDYNDDYSDEYSSSRNSQYSKGSHTRGSYHNSYDNDDSSQEEEDWQNQRSDEEETEEDCTEDEDETESDEELRPKLRSGGYMPEPPAAEIKEIINDIMEEEEVYPMDIPREGLFHPAKVNKKSLRYYSTKGFAWFCCPKRHHRWPSAHSWCYLDLRKQKICTHRYKQQCKVCDTSVSPEFSSEAIEHMARYAVEQYLYRTGLRKRTYRGPREGDGRMTNNKPHDEERCTKCQELGRSCWRKN